MQCCAHSALASLSTSSTDVGSGRVGFRNCSLAVRTWECNRPNRLGRHRVPFVADGLAGPGALEEPMQRRRWFAVVLIALLLTGCAQGMTGQAGAPYPPYSPENRPDRGGDMM